MIFTVTLNPAVDKVLFLETFQPSRTHRLERSLDTIGGKGTHVSINLKLQGVESTALGVTLGENGRKIERMLAEWGVTVEMLHFDLPGMESRTNYEIVESRGQICTMLTERGPLLPQFITDALQDQIRERLGADDLLVLTGDASNVEDKTIYSKLIHLAKQVGARVFLDASGTYLKEGLTSGPTLIKPNLEELSFLCGKVLETEADIVSALRELDKFNIPMIAMTWGEAGSILKIEEQYFRVLPIPVKTVNAGGCGDAFLAAILAGVVQKLPVDEMLKNAAAVSAAAAESEITAGFDVKRAEDLKLLAVVEKISAPAR
jgi:1-phosphofructokinase family hexose kinase